MEIKLEDLNIVVERYKDNITGDRLYIVQPNQVEDFGDDDVISFPKEKLGEVIVDL